jgi:hypothetical protein
MVPINNIGDIWMCSEAKKLAFYQRKIRNKRKKGRNSHPAAAHQGRLDVYSGASAVLDKPLRSPQEAVNLAWQLLQFLEVLLSG